MEQLARDSRRRWRHLNVLDFDPTTHPLCPSLPRAGWISMLLLEFLLNGGSHPAQRTCRQHNLERVRAFDRHDPLAEPQ